MSRLTDIQFAVHRGVELEAHWHSELELLYVVEGTLTVESGERQVKLAEEDVVLINSGISHRVEGRHALFCLVKYPLALLGELLGSGSQMFLCSSPEDTRHSYAQVRSIFRELLALFIQPRRHTDCLRDSLLLRLLDLLIEQFRLEIRPEERDRLSNELRLQHIIQFVNQSYQSNLSLSRLAGELQVSTSTLSRFFKKQTGFYFVDYVNQIRIKASMKELSDSDENITKIAVNSGFSNLTVFNRVFREINGCSPSDWRRLSRETAQSLREARLREEEELREHLQRRAGEESHSRSARQVTLTADGRAGQSYHRAWTQAVNIGSACQLTQSNLQSHLLYLRDQLGLSCARVWNVFARGLMITDGRRVGGCCFDHLDSVLDFLVEHHITPWLDLGRRPNTINRNETELVFQENECIVFQSRRVWEHLVSTFVRHLVQRYGRDTVSRWRFGLTYIPTGRDEHVLYRSEEGPFHYPDAFQFFYRTVKEYLPDALTGGPGVVSDYRPQFLTQTLRELTDRGCVPDFVSVMVYPYESQRDSLMARRTRRQDWEVREIGRVRRLMDEVGLTEQMLYLCEWNCTLSNRNFLNDSCFRSACLIHNAVRLRGQADLAAICMGSDWVDNHYDTFRIVNGNMGLIGQQNIRKPVFFAMHFLKSLGAFLIHCDEHCVVTRTDHYSYYVLCFHYVPLGETYFAEDEDIPSPAQLEGLYSNRDPLELNLNLTGMPEGVVYTVKRRSINDREGSILPEWGRFRYDEQLEDSDVRYLRDACFPRMSMERLTVRDGTLRIRETLQPNEVSLLHIYQRI